MKVVDGQGGSASAVVTITVADQPEPPSVPSTPRVAATSGSGKSLDVTWNEPSNTGPSINDYDIQYREVGGSDDRLVGLAPRHYDDGSTDRSAKITDLDPRKTYEVEVQAHQLRGHGEKRVVVRRPRYDERQQYKAVLRRHGNCRGR